MDFYRLQVRDFSRVSKRHTVDSKYWKKLSVRKTKSINGIHI